VSFCPAKSIILTIRSICKTAGLVFICAAELTVHGILLAQRAIMIPEKIQNPVCSLDELHTIQILDGIDDRRLEALRKHLCLVEHEQGDVILHQGEVSEALYFLLSGQVAAILKEENGKQHSLAELTPGDTFGEHALLTGGSTRIFSSLNSAPCTFSPLCFDRRNSFFLASAK
jgi:hypothetical protein